MNDDEVKGIVNFLFEVGTMRKIRRAHQQTLLADDSSDNIASHSYRVGIIAWFLAKMEGVDPYKVAMMAILHDLKEARSGDHNWVHKKYMQIFESEIVKDQLGQLPFGELHDIVMEFEERESPESLVAKDADLLDEVLLLREYAWQGNQEAQKWLHEKRGEENPTGENMQIKLLKTESAKKLGAMIIKTGPSDWWENIWTSRNR